MDKTESSNVINILVSTGAYLEMQTDIGLKKANEMDEITFPEHCRSPLKSHTAFSVRKTNLPASKGSNISSIRQISGRRLTVQSNDSSFPRRS